jgi:purine-binding chemotaxis protein CheW
MTRASVPQTDLLRRKAKAPLDWEEVRSRLASVAAATQESSRMAPEEARRILEERARRLARVPARAPDSADVLEVVTFVLGQETYALETRFVSEVLRHPETTPLPGAPEFVAGIIGVRGQIIAVFELRPLFGLDPRDADIQPWAILIGTERTELAILADAVLEVATLRIHEILAPPASSGGNAGELIRGVTPEALIVLDGEVLLRHPRLVIEQNEEKLS